MIYKIPSNGARFSDGIKNHFNKGRYERYKIKDIEVMESLYIDSRYVTLILVDNQDMGIVVLKKGINNKFKVEKAFYGSSHVNGRVLSINKDVVSIKDNSYLVVYGENDFKAKYIEANLYDYTHRLELDNGEYFITHMSFPVERDRLYEAEIKYFDENNKDITMEVEQRSND